VCEAAFALVAFLFIARMIDVLGKPAFILALICLVFLYIIAGVPGLGIPAVIVVVGLWVAAAFIIGIRRFMF
jgi:hypothetical protein